jgi:MHS family shikimate/dehydroshikimate transporter-like MFS transporter
MRTTFQRPKEDIMVDTASPTVEPHKPVQPVASTPKETRKVAFASLVGTSIEWYDFFIYGQAAALVFNVLFFPELDPALGVLAGLATFGVGFVARPIGGIIFGHFGDRIGRKTALVTTLVLMGGATFLVGVLPTYEQIGLWAPILLVVLRLVQGFAVGGEWGGAVLMAVEHAPKGKRGFYGSWPQMGIPIGLISASTVLYFLSVGLPEEQFLAWGWRVPFLASMLLVIVGLVIRLKVSESPLFKKLQEEGKHLKTPLLDVLKNAWGRTLLAIFMQASVNVGFYVIGTYSISYAATYIGMSRGETLAALMIAAVLDLIAIPLWATLSDRIGRKPVLIFGSIFLGAFMYPFFLMVQSGDVVQLTIAISVGMVFGHAPCYALLASMLSETFDAKSRYSGVSLAYQLSGALISGPTPFVAAALVIGADGSFAPVVIMAIVAALVSVICLMFMRETRHASL